MNFLIRPATRRCARCCACLKKKVSSSTKEKACAMSICLPSRQRRQCDRHFATSSQHFSAAQRPMRRPRCWKCQMARCRARIVLCHELAHVERFDVLTNLIADLACLLYWFNPLVWMATRALRYERERACDDYVLACGEKPSVYASALLELSERLGAGKYSSPAIAMAHQPRLERRLLAILASDISRSQISRLSGWAS